MVNKYITRLIPKRQARVLDWKEVEKIVTDQVRGFTFPSVGQTREEYKFKQPYDAEWNLNRVTFLEECNKIWKKLAIEEAVKCGKK